MFGIFAGLGGLFATVLSTFVWIGLIGGLTIYVICLIIDRFFLKSLPAVALPTFSIVKNVALLVGGLCAIIKVIGFVLYLMTAQNQIADLKEQLEKKDTQIGELQQNAGRKEAQAAEVTNGDKEVDVRYVNKWRTIESIRTVPDLSLANRLMLDYTTNFYEPEKSDEAK